MSSFQANPDGALVNGEDPTHPSVEERDRLLRDALAKNNYVLDDLRQTAYPHSRFVKFTADIHNGTTNLALEIFWFPNLAWSSGGRSKHEKRIQITQDWSDHQHEFALSKTTGNRRCLLLGSYTRGGVTVFCAWDAEAYTSHAKPTSCYLRVEAIAAAMRDGFGQSVDNKGRLVCCFRPEFVHYYLNNMAELHERVVVSDLSHTTPGEANEEPSPQEDIQSVVANPVRPELARNRVVYGAPGTGKSFRLASEAAEFFPDPILWKRVTFYPDYSYANLVGVYRPIPVYRETPESLYEADKVTKIDGNKSPIIDYRFVAGPLLEMYCRAVNWPNHNFLLIVEELNRTDAAAAFGDWFQLLDRDSSGQSEFAITASQEVGTYLMSQGVGSGDIRLPRNLYIWSTMNSADQGVLPLDAAFKRRWTFDYIGLEDERSVVDDWKLQVNYVAGGEISWNAFRDAINGKLRQIGVTEDRLLGPFFLKKEELNDSKAFKNKLLMYLREDVVRHEPEQLFCAGTLGEIVSMYDNGQNVFNDIVF